MVTSAQQKAASDLLFFFSSVSRALMTRWRPGPSSIPWDSVLERGLFNIFVSDTESGIRAPSASLQMTPAVDGLEGNDAVQRDFDTPKWACANFMGFSKTKRKVLHLCQRNSKRKYRHGFESIPE